LDREIGVDTKRIKAYMDDSLLDNDDEEDAKRAKEAVREKYFATQFLPQNDMAAWWQIYKTAISRGNGTTQQQSTMHT
jgi:hypothetical protein